MYTTKIYDQTLMSFTQISKNDIKIGVLEIYDKLKSLGVDYIELDLSSLDNFLFCLQETSNSETSKSVSLIINISNSSVAQEVFETIRIIKKYIDFHHNIAGLVINIQDLKSANNHIKELLDYMLKCNKNMQLIINVVVQDMLTESKSILEKIDALISLKNNFQLAKSITAIRLLNLSKTKLPVNILELIKTKKQLEIRNIKLQVMVYDDNYTATAISSACLQARVSGIVVSMMGNTNSKQKITALEQLVMASIITSPSVLGDISFLYKFAREIAGLQAKAIDKRMAILGANIFDCESAIHVDGIKKDPAIYEPWSPQLTGHRRQVVYGKHSAVNKS